MSATFLQNAEYDPYDIAELTTHITAMNENSNDDQYPEQWDLDMLHDFSKNIYRCFCYSSNGEVKQVMEHITARNMAIFPNPRHIQPAYQKYVKFIELLSNALDNRENSEDDTELKSKIRILLCNSTRTLIRAKESVHYAYVQLVINNSEHNVAPDEVGVMDEYQAETLENELKDVQKLILYLLGEARKRCYRKRVFNSKAALYEPLYINDHFTYHFQYALDVSDFFYDAMYPYHVHSTIFKWATSSPSTRSHTIEFISSCRSANLPLLEKCRYKFSFRNGVYDTKHDIFYPYEDDDNWPHKISQLDSNTVTCKFFDSIFDYQLYETQLRENNDPFDIATPHCQRILDTQKFEKDVCKWAYASLGRMTPDVREMDDWQFLPFFKGLGATGKSTLLNLIQKILQ